MLTSLHVSNFKALHSLQLKNLKKINVFIGQNSSGKSSILQSMAFLAQSVGSKIKYTGKMVDLGSFDETVFGHKTRRKIRIDLSFSISNESGDLLIIGRPGRRKEPVLLSGNVEFAVEIGGDGISKQELKSPELEIDCVFSREPTERPGEMGDRLYLNREDVMRLGSTVTHLLKWHLGEPKHKLRGSGAIEYMTEKIDFTNLLLNIVRNKLNTLYYFSTTRAIEEWSQELRETDSFGTLGQDAISMLHHVYSNYPDTFRRIAKWIEKIGVGTLFSTIRGAKSSILLGDPMLGIRSNLVSSGFGINQLIGIVRIS